MAKQKKPLPKANINKAIFLMITCTIFTSLAQLFLKSGVSRIQLTFIGMITNWVLILGVVFYGLGALIMIFALKQGELSLLYPFLSLSYVWVPILSIFVVHESLVLMQWLGIAMIILGSFFMRRGATYA
ncbi:EamA family transporter [Candidatus Woesearchaeota archaeon]|nr:EamA family transporter [Candidatus Woesearchaeota archaeon]